MDFWGSDTIANQLGDFSQPVPNENVYSTGMITYFTSTEIPVGFLECNGQAVYKSLYPALFNLIGNTFDISGTPATQFCLPNLNGRTVSVKNALFDVSGQTTVVLEANQLPPHSHSTYRGLSTNVDPGGGAFPSAPVSLNLSDISSTIPMKDASGNTITDPPDAIPIMNPYISLIYIIKY